MNMLLSIAHRLLHQSTPSSLQPRRGFLAERVAHLFPDQAEAVGGLMHNYGLDRPFW